MNVVGSVAKPRNQNRRPVCNDPIFGPLKLTRALKKELNRDIRIGDNKPTDFAAFKAPNKYSSPMTTNTNISSEYRHRDMREFDPPRPAQQSQLQRGQPPIIVRPKTSGAVMPRESQPHFMNSIHHDGSVHDHHSKIVGDAIVDLDHEGHVDKVNFSREHFNQEEQHRRPQRPMTTQTHDRQTNGKSRTSPAREMRASTSSRNFRFPETQKPVYVAKIGARRTFKVLAYIERKGGKKEYFDIETHKPILVSTVDEKNVVNKNLTAYDTKEGACMECANNHLPRVLAQFDCWGTTKRRLGGVPSANYEYARFVKAVANLDPVVVIRPRQKRDHDKKKTVVDKFHMTALQKEEKFKSRAQATRSYILQNLFLSGYKSSVNELRKPKPGEVLPW